MKNQMNTKRIAAIYKEMNKKYFESEFISFSFGGIHVSSEGLLEIAPASEWIIEKRDHSVYPLEASCNAHGVKWFAVLTQETLDKCLSSE